VTSETSYELTGRIAVFKGRRADGVMVLMHQLTLGFDHNDVLKLALAYLLRNPPASGGLILDLVQRDGLTYLVTADMPQCVELSGWLAREVGQLTREAEVIARLPHVAPQTPAAISEPVALGHRSPQPAAEVAGPSPAQTPEPEGGSASPANAPQPAPSMGSPAGAPPAIDAVEAQEVPLPAFLGAPPPVMPPSPVAPATYVIAQPKAGLAKTILFTGVGFLVVAAVFWIVIVVVRGMK
jgi:hypothetical protein